MPGLSVSNTSVRATFSAHSSARSAATDDPHVALMTWPVTTVMTSAWSGETSGLGMVDMALLEGWCDDRGSHDEAGITVRGDGEGGPVGEVHGDHELVDTDGEPDGLDVGPV